MRNKIKNKKSMKMMMKTILMAIGVFLISSSNNVSLGTDWWSVLKTSSLYYCIYQHTNVASSYYYGDIITITGATATNETTNTSTTNDANAIMLYILAKDSDYGYGYRAGGTATKYGTRQKVLYAYWGAWISRSGLTFSSSTPTSTNSDWKIKYSTTGTASLSGSWSSDMTTLWNRANSSTHNEYLNWTDEDSTEVASVEITNAGYAKDTEAGYLYLGIKLTYSRSNIECANLQRGRDGNSRPIEPILLRHLYT